MSSAIRIGLTQFDLAWEQPLANHAAVESMLSDAPEMDLLVLPEMWSTGFTMNTAASESLHGPTLDWMTAHAIQYGMSICGSISVSDGQHAYNRFYVSSPNGTVQSYDKRHLFSFGKEEQHYVAGREKLLFTVGEWRIRPIICYDLRFPAWCRNQDDYDILLCVANWPQARIHHWDALLRARAIENQCFVVSVNRIGTDHNQLQYPGHSSVYDMDGGQRLLMPENRRGIDNIALDREELIQYRQHYRFLQDRDRFNI